MEGMSVEKSAVAQVLSLPYCQRMKKNATLNIRIEPDTLEKVRLAAKRQQLRAAELVRRAIEADLEAHGDN